MKRQNDNSVAQAQPDDTVSDIMTFGRLVRQARTKLGLTQEALAAEALGNADRKGYISNIENGRLPGITSDTVRKIAEAIDISAEQVPVSLHWHDALVTQPAETEPEMHAGSQATGLWGTLSGVLVVLGMVVFSGQIASGLTTFWEQVRPAGQFAVVPLFAWLLAGFSAAFFFLGLQGSGAERRAAWIERSSWRDGYLRLVGLILGWFDRSFLPAKQISETPALAFRRNWSIGLYEKVLAFAIIYPSALWMVQWGITGADQRLGHIITWPADPDVGRRVFIVFGFLAALPLVLLARRVPQRWPRLGICLLALVLNVAASASANAAYEDTFPGPGTVGLIGTFFIIGVGFRLFDTVAVPVAATSIAGTIVTFMFVPMLSLAEFLTDQQGAGYGVKVVADVHVLLHYTINIVLVVVIAYVASRVITKALVERNQPGGIAIYGALSVFSLALTAAALTQPYWTPYHLMLGLIPVLNAMFDFASVGLTSYMLRCGYLRFGWRTLAFSVLDLMMALSLFVVLVLTMIGGAIFLNMALGAEIIPLDTGLVEACLGPLNISPPPGLIAAPQPGSCSGSLSRDILENPTRYSWLLVTFGSTLLPTALHLCLALFALGPALLSAPVRRNLVHWTRAADGDGLMRLGAALALGLWLAVVATVVLLVADTSVGLLRNGPVILGISR